MDDEVIHDVIVGDFVVRLLLVGFERVEPLAARELRLDLLVVEPIRACLVVSPVARRKLVVVGDEDRAGHPPVRRVGLGAGERLALRIVLPMRFEPVRQQEIRRQRMEVAPAHRDHALGERCDDGTDDFRPGLLERLCHVADADRQRARPRE